MPILNLGRLVATASMAERMGKDIPFSHFVNASIKQFKKADWGDVAESDKAQNDNSLKNGEGSIHGAYKTSDGKTVIWIFMEWDHKTTTILFPDEW